MNNKWSTITIETKSAEIDADQDGYIINSIHVVCFKLHSHTNHNVLKIAIYDPSSKADVANTRE